MAPMTDAAWQKYLAAAEAANPGPRRFKKWKMAGRPPLAIDENIKCSADVKTGGEDEDWEPCGKRSCFIVERSDGDESFGVLGGGEEACEEHLWEAVYGMMDGDDALHAIVTPRWDAGDGLPDEVDQRPPAGLSRLTARQRDLILRSLTHSANHTYLEDEAEYLDLIRALGLEDAP